MKVFKFGGASVNSVERIKNIPKILQQFKQENLVIIISAIGKTTNALEKVVDSFFNQNQNVALELFTLIKNQHIDLAKEILGENFKLINDDLNNLFTEVEWLLHDKPARSYDYYYDQIVSIGELLSTKIISSFLEKEGINNTWLDVRDYLRTDNNFRAAIVDWKISTEKISTLQFNNETSTRYITQGFIGATDENESTTLGREGSDFSAAIFANILNAESVTIWKDVEGVMNADPKQFKDAVLIDELNFEEVIEMAFYGAQIIHPKTIKPLQNKKIPLLVKCFLDPALKGTIIKDDNIKQLPPIIIIKKNQVLMNLKTKDFSFVGDKPMNFLYELFGALKLKPNLIQTGAINVQLCMDENELKIQELALQASAIFDVELQKNLELTTIRHYTKDSIQDMLQNKNVLLKQQTKETVQVLCF